MSSLLYIFPYIIVLSGKVCHKGYASEACLSLCASNINTWLSLLCGTLHLSREPLFAFLLCAVLQAAGPVSVIVSVGGEAHELTRIVSWRSGVIMCSFITCKNVMWIVFCSEAGNGGEWAATGSTQSRSLIQCSTNTSRLFLCSAKVVTSSCQRSLWLHRVTLGCEFVCFWLCVTDLAGDDDRGSAAASTAVGGAAGRAAAARQLTHGRQQPSARAAG